MSLILQTALQVSLFWASKAQKRLIFFISADQLSCYRIMEVNAAGIPTTSSKEIEQCYGASSCMLMQIDAIISIEEYSGELMPSKLFSAIILTNYFAKKYVHLLRIGNLFSSP